MSILLDIQISIIFVFLEFCIFRLNTSIHANTSYMSTYKYKQFHNSVFTCFCIPYFWKYGNKEILKSSMLVGKNLMHLCTQTGICLYVSRHAWEHACVSASGIHESSCVYYISTYTDRHEWSVWMRHFIYIFIYTFLCKYFIVGQFLLQFSRPLYAMCTSVFLSWPSYEKYKISIFQDHFLLQS